MEKQSELKKMIVKKILAFSLSIIVILGALKVVNAQEMSNIYFFYGRGCLHCAKVEEFFSKHNLYIKYPIEKKEIYFDRNNALLFNQMMVDLEIPEIEQEVPTVVIGKKVLAGDQFITDNFIAEADSFLQQKQLQKATIEQPKFDLTLGLVVGGSVVDAINPCAFAVLIILMTTILATGDGKKALKAGIAFSTSIFISYFLMGLGVYKALGVGGMSGLFYKIIGWLAIVLGLLNLKDYFWYEKGFLMEVPMSWRPKLKSLIGSVTSPLGAFGMGFLVSLFLLPCTSGPYIVILGMLAEKTLQAKAILYLALYNFIFISPMLLISLAVYRGFDPAKAEEIRQKRLKTLHLIAGIILLAMGVVILKNGFIFD